MRDSIVSVVFRNRKILDRINDDIVLFDGEKEMNRPGVDLKTK